MAAIDIGTAATTRSNVFGIANTRFAVGNPANLSGKITSIEIYLGTAGSNVEVATFYLVSGSNYSTRDIQTIGAVASGSKQTFSVDLDVGAGDYLGAYDANAEIYVSLTGDGVSWRTGDNIPCTNVEFTPQADREMSLYGIGVSSKTYECSATDGLKAGDTSLTQAILNALSSDGIKQGDSTLTQVILNSLATDGLKVGDLSALIKVFTDSLTDGFKLGDSPGTTTILNAFATDGFKLSDTPTIIRVYILLLALDLYARNLTFGLKNRNLTVDLGNRNLTMRLRGK